MKVWLLDDKHFPTGYANGLIKNRYPDLAPWGITEHHLDVIGPVTDGAVMADWGETDGILLEILACERSGEDESLTGRIIDITDGLSNGMVYFLICRGAVIGSFFFIRHEAIPGPTISIRFQLLQPMY